MTSGALGASDPHPLSPRRVAAMIAAAIVLHGAFDAAAFALGWATPPYLRLSDAPEAFHMLSPLAVGIAASCVSGLIAVVALVALEPRRRTAWPVGIAVTAFWLFSATLMRAVWLSTPWSTTALALLAGIPRGLVIGWCLARIVAADGVSASRGEAA